MALRDQPYLPLYVQDFLTDEKLIECSPATTGVYIRLMCIMHKSKEYGSILLQQKDKQSPQQIKNFAAKLARQMPWPSGMIESGLSELLCEGVLEMDDGKLFQPRMIKDNYLSLLRSEVGKKGGFATAKRSANTTAKSVANTEDENEYEIENEYETKNVNKKLISEIFEIWQKEHDHLEAKLDAKRKKAIKERLKEGYSAVRIIQAIRGIKLSPHNMGKNDRNTVYDDIELICRSGANVDRFADMRVGEPKLPGLDRYKNAMIPETEDNNDKK